MPRPLPSVGALMLAASACAFAVSPNAASQSAVPRANVHTGQPQPRPAPASGFDWPVDEPAILHRFEAPKVKWGPGHRGVDLASPQGAAVKAAGPGIVAFSGVVAGKGVVTIRHARGFDTTYEPLDDRITQGTAVKRGDVLGRLASTHAEQGHCTQVCLHWGYRVGKDVYRDPLTLLRSGPVVLLPPL